MKPIEAADYLRNLVAFVATDARVPDYIKTWFCEPSRQYLSGSKKRFDQLLFLRSRNGGRLTLHCTIPARDTAIRTLAASLKIKSLKGQAAEITRLKKAGELTRIQALGRIPGDRRLVQIIVKAT